MRFLRYVLFFLLLASGVAVAGLLAWQELVVFTAKQGLEEQLDQYTSQVFPSQAYEYCKELGTLSTPDQPLFTLRLRFIDDRQYVVEVVCDQYEFVPLVLSQDSLGSLVKKIPGSAGFEFEPGVWRIELRADPHFLPQEMLNTQIMQTLLFRRASVVVANGRLTPDSGLTVTQPTTPITNCTGYGFTCCLPIAERGVGDSRPASDCSELCFEYCQPVPQVYWLATNNGYDRQERVTTVIRNETVVFSFAGESTDPTTTKAYLDFGDGTNWQGSMVTETINHQYSCATNQCQYEATLTLTDQAGVDSVMTENARLTVLVR